MLRHAAVHDEFKLIYMTSIQTSLHNNAHCPKRFKRLFDLLRRLLPSIVSAFDTRRCDGRTKDITPKQIRTKQTTRITQQPVRAVDDSEAKSQKL